MLDNIKIEGFRGLKNFSLTGTSRFNIIVGPNNVGKSSILEALSIFCYPDFENIFTLLNIRTEGIHNFYKNYLFSEIAEFFTSVSYRFEGEENNLKILGTWNNLDREVLLKLHFNKLDKDKINLIPQDKIHNEGVALGNLSIKCIYQGDILESLLEFEESPEMRVPEPSDEISINHLLCDSLAHRTINQKSMEIFYNTIKNINFDDFIAILQEIDPDIESINLVNRKFIGLFQLMVKFKSKNELIPFTSLGEGLRKVLYITFALGVCRDGVLLIDELESAIHTTALVNFTKWMFTLAKKLNVQVFITTHSLECIDAILSVKEIPPEELNLFKLKRKDDQILSKKMKGESLRKIRYELGQDVRW